MFKNLETDNKINKTKIKEITVSRKHPKYERSYEEITIITKKLYYQRGKSKVYLLGRYEIIIPMISSRSIKINNLDYNIAHPCIFSDSICWGASTGYLLKQLKKQKMIKEMMYLIINFLETPNYRGPHYYITYLIKHRKKINEKE